MYIKEFLQSISNSGGVSGYEYNLKNLIENVFKEYSDEITVDKLGNVIALKKGINNHKNIKIMIATHMDEIGLMVKDIEENGFLRFTNIGGVDPRTILGQEVIVHGNKDFMGVIGSKPPHLQEVNEHDKSIKMEDMIIDVGMTLEDIDGEINIGDTVTIKRSLKDLLNNRVAGKALDNRAGIAASLACLIELNKITHESDIYFVSTVQEEVSMAGALTSAYNINPNIGIAVDVGFGHTPELSKSQTLDLGKGPGITLGGNIHPNLRKKLVSIANEYNIPNQIEIDPGPTGTDGRAIQITRAGIPTLVLSIPLRYMHTSVELIDMEDINNTGKLLAFFISAITSENLEGLLCY